MFFLVLSWPVECDRCEVVCMCVLVYTCTRQARYMMIM